MNTLNNEKRIRFAKEWLAIWRATGSPNFSSLMLNGVLGTRSEIKVLGSNLSIKEIGVVPGTGEGVWKIFSDDRDVTRLTRTILLDRVVDKHQCILTLRDVDHFVFVREMGGHLANIHLAAAIGARDAAALDQFDGAAVEAALARIESEHIRDALQTDHVPRRQKVSARL